MKPSSSSIEAIIAEWIDRLTTEAGVPYVKRPRAELVETVSAAYDANMAFIDQESRAKINKYGLTPSNQG